MRRSPRKTVDLSESVHKQLNMYALAAGAAGVSLLALAQPSEAKIVYRPTLVNIPPNTSYKLDLGLGPVPILSIGNFRTFMRSSGTPLVYCSARLKAVGNQRGALAGHYAQYAHGGHTWVGSALVSGASIGPKLQFQGAAVMTAFFHRNGTSGVNGFGSWGNVTNRYLGMSFQVNGQVHYGWARLSVRSTYRCRVFATLTGYAYETVPNKPIIAGQTHGADAKQPAPASRKTNSSEPATLGVLALGSPGLSIWRREE
jgi:hypothetical protein